MGDGPEVHGEWDPASPTEPPAALLRRAISHVESLLVRLDPGAEASRSGPFAVPDVAPTHSEVPPVPSPTTAAEAAEALRRTLHAHEEALRQRTGSAGRDAGAKPAADRFLIESRVVGERVEVESRRAVNDLLASARREAASILDKAGADADRIRRQALDDAQAEARELLASTHDAVAAVRATTQQLTTGLTDALASLAAATVGLDDLRGGPNATSTPDPLRAGLTPELELDNPPAAGTHFGADRHAGFDPQPESPLTRDNRDRRPLGQLFGARRT